MVSPESRTIRAIFARCLITSSGCFEWTGGKSIGGGKSGRSRGFYPSVWVVEERKTRRGHVVVGEAFHGPCPDGYEWGHKCGNSLCLNPRDLEPQSREDNRRERVERYRALKVATS